MQNTTPQYWSKKRSTHWAATLMNFLRSCTLLLSCEHRHISVTTQNWISLNLLRNRSRFTVVLLAFCFPNVLWMSSSFWTQQKSTTWINWSKKIMFLCSKPAGLSPSYLMYTVEKLPVVGSHVVGHVLRAHHFKCGQWPCGGTLLLR